MALEPEFWSALADIASETGLTLPRLLAKLDAERVPEQPLASALRVLALAHFRARR